MSDLKQKYIKTVTTSSTLLYSDMGEIIVNSASTPTVTVPDATSVEGLWYRFINIGSYNASIQNVSLSPITTISPNMSSLIVSDGTNWIVSKVPEYDLLGTSNQITVTGGTDSLFKDVTLSLPQNIHSGASPTFSGATLSSLTALRLLASDGSKILSSVADLTSWIAGTANQIIATSDGDGTITLSLPQNINTSATPTFSNMIFTNLSTNKIINVDGNGLLESVADLTQFISGTANEITVTNNGDGTVTLSTPQDIGISSTPTFGGVMMPFGAFESGYNIDGEESISVTSTQSVDITGHHDGFFNIYNDTTFVAYVRMSDGKIRTLGGLQVAGYFINNDGENAILLDSDEVKMQMPLTSVGTRNARRIVTNSCTPLITNDVIVCNKSTDMEIFLPPSWGNGQIFVIKNINTGDVIVYGYDGDVIDGNPTTTLAQWDSVRLADVVEGYWVKV